MPVLACPMMSWPSSAIGKGQRLDRERVGDAGGEQSGADRLVDAELFKGLECGDVGLVGDKISVDQIG